MGCWQVKGKGWRYSFEKQGRTHTGQWFVSKAEAKAARAEHRKRLKQELKNNGSPPSWDFDFLILDYLQEARRKFQPKTWKYKRFVYQSFRDHAGNLQLSEINAYLVSKYLLTRPSNYNYNFHRKDLGALFTWAVNKGLMAVNPCLKSTAWRKSPASWSTSPMKSGAGSSWRPARPAFSSRRSTTPWAGWGKSCG